MLTRCEHVVPGTEHVVVGSEKKKKARVFFSLPSRFVRLGEAQSKKSRGVSALVGEPRWSVTRCVEMAGTQWGTDNRWRVLAVEKGGRVWLGTVWRPGSFFARWSKFGVVLAGRAGGQYERNGGVVGGEEGDRCSCGRGTLQCVGLGQWDGNSRYWGGGGALLWWLGSVAAAALLN